MKPLYIVLILIGLAIFAGGIGWLIWWSSLRAYRSNTTWPEIALRLGLNHTPDETPSYPGTISGSFSGYEVSIKMHKEYRDAPDMIVTARFGKPLDLGIQMGTDIRTRGDEKPGSTQFSTGNESFDKKFRGRATDTTKARQLFELNPVQEALRGLAEQSGNVGVDDEKLTLITSKIIIEAPPMEQLLRRVVDAARVVETAGH